MNDHIKGCGKDEGQRTLYVVKDDVPPIPLGATYWHVRCGYHPPSRILASPSSGYAPQGIPSPSYDQLPLFLRESSLENPFERRNPQKYRAEKLSLSGIR